MTAQLPEPVKLERPDVDWERHKGTGAPKVLPPPGVAWRSASGKTKQRHRYYTRVTTYADAISDQYNLGKWRMRRIALGMGQRPDYVRLASSLTDRDDDRDALDELVGKALEAAGPNKADEGTALHALTERIDRGEPLGNPPDELVPDLLAYEVLSGELFVFVQRECRVVCDELECAGTPDGIAHLAERCPAGCGPEVLHVVDTKTGSIRYPAKMAIQLAIYSRSKRYDPATGERHELGDGRPVCQQWGAIVHLPVESGRAAPYWLDLTLGWHGAELCGPVREWNSGKTDNILVPFAEVLPVVAQADGTIERGEVRLASHNPKAPTAAPATPTDLTEQLAASLKGTPYEGVVATVAEVVDDDPIAERSSLDPAPDPNPGYLENGDNLTAVIAETDPLMGAILTAATERDLELVWQRDRAGWQPEHLALANERFGMLRAEREAEKPRAAMRAAIDTAATIEVLTTLMIDHRDEPWMTDELRQLADARYWTLRGQPAREGARA